MDSTNLIKLHNLGETPLIIIYQTLMQKNVYRRHHVVFNLAQTSVILKMFAVLTLKITGEHTLKSDTRS